MKRKFLAKAITLGLMLAVPLGAQAADNLKYAQGIVINNVDNRTVDDVKGDVNLSLDIPVTNFANLNQNIDYIVGVANVTGDNAIVMDSANITNTNFVTDADVAEMAGIFNLQGSTTVNKDVTIKLSAEGTKAGSGLGVFGIRTVWWTKYDDVNKKYVADYDNKVSTITIGGNTKLDISGKAKFLAGILLQDNDGTNLNLGENTDIKVTDTSKNDSVYLYGINSNYAGSNIKAKNVKIELNGGQQQTGFFVNKGDSTLSNIEVNLNDASKSAEGVVLINAEGSHTSSITGNTIVNINSSSKDNAFKANGFIFAFGSEESKNQNIYLGKSISVDIKADNGTINAIDCHGSGKYMNNKANIEIGTANVNVVGGKVIRGIRLDGSEKMDTINKVNISIVGNENTEEITALKTGNWTFEESATKTIDINDVDIRIGNENKNIKDKVVGLELVTNNGLKISGDVNLDVKNGYAIKTAFYNDKQFLHNGLVLGKDKDGKDTTVKIKGDILGSVDGNGTIKLNLNNSDSYFIGTNTGKTEITLKDGATWTNTGASTVTSLDVNGATLVQGAADATITKFTENTTGSSSTKFTIAGNNTTSDGSTMTGSQTLFAGNAFDTVADDTKISITSANQNAANISKENAAKSFNNLVNALGDEQLKSKVTSAHLDGSYTANAIDAEIDKETGKFTNGNIKQDTGDTATVAAIKKLPSINLVSWRTENNELSKRLGEVRDYDGEEGIWARMNHGESKYLDSFKTKAHLYQMGYDKKVGEWRLGGAVSYNKGTTTYENGSGKNRSTSLALYGAWLGDKGHYADIIVKEGKQKSEMTIGQTGLAASNLDYDMWATSISAEYGRKIALENNWFVEPQAELTYGCLGSADYGDNGFTVHQDSMDSLVGRMGFRLGKNLSDTSNIYLKASLLHEFCGDVDYTFTEGSTSTVSNTDLGDTWYEVGVGGSAQIGKATYAYAGIEKTFGGDFSTPWQWNAGVRWSF